MSRDFGRRQVQSKSFGVVADDAVHGSTTVLCLALVHELVEKLQDGNFKSHAGRPSHESFLFARHSDNGKAFAAMVANVTGYDNLFS